MNTVELAPPYLIFLGDIQDPVYAKTGFGVVQWRKEQCLGQLRLADGCIDLGLPTLGIEEAVASGVRTLIIGTATIGGGVPPAWLEVLSSAIEAGLDVAGGLHTRLNNIDLLVNAAQKSGARLIDVREPPPELSVGTGLKRRGKRLLTVGTDCAVGKKYTALAIEQSLSARGFNATFRASGQTGIMITGSGIPLDAVPCDFLVGAAEQLSPENLEDHWDIIEGQGSIMHPGYCAVSHGLLVGSQPDHFIVCHQAGRTHFSGWPTFQLPSITEVIERTILLGQLSNPRIRCAGLSINTSQLPAEQRENYLQALEQEFHLPCVDPLLTGVDPIINFLEKS